MRMRYLHRVSGPLLDRLDLHVVVPPVPFGALASPQSQEPSTAQVRMRVEAARARQRSRYHDGATSTATNARLTLDDLEHVATLDDDAKELVNLAMAQGQLSARGYVRVLRVARTIADLDACAPVSMAHLGEALRYRLSDLSQL